MVKVLACADFHGSNVFSRDLAKKAVDNDVDLVVVCGDITEHGEEHNNQLLSPFVEAGKKVVFVTGNHESISLGDFLAEVYNVKHIHSSGVRYGDVGFIGCGSANCGINALDEEEIFEILKDGDSKINYLRKKVFVTHVFPSDSLMDKMSHPSLPGSVGLSKAIKEFKPDVTLCSHAHEADGVEQIIDGCRVICVGRKGTLLDL